MPIWRLDRPTQDGRKIDSNDKCNYLSNMDDKNKKPQPDLIEHWETLTAKYLTLRSSVLPKIGNEIENEELSNILQEKEDSNLTIL